MSSPPTHTTALTPFQARQVQHMAANVLIEAYASGRFSTMSDESLCRRVEYYLNWSPHSLDSQEGCTLLAQIRWLMVYHFHATMESSTIRYAILGLVLGVLTARLPPIKTN
ncbi:hypothetical protein PLEOSDRAFT_152365 [Pleurotus ostreatus PC15]|uniref:Uncharacterized protein n=1 Tax=Pleurotus ostreatus (strain PC15) TaxID=1137138 RepID=A0A067P428_PLEO1|nr:hypothetical protein PLEOSDRAFT_152365 [Pleurotus ostreatus PC15]